ncbi:MAG: hypothetical protein ACJ0HG_01050 [Alphaproteobacteria bacterium]
MRSRKSLRDKFSGFSLGSDHIAEALEVCTEGGGGGGGGKYKLPRKRGLVGHFGF